MPVLTTRRVLLALAIPAAALAIGAGGAAVAAPATDTCGSNDVSVTLGTVESGAGQRYAPLTITAKAGVTCQLSGYASGFAFRAADGTALPTDAKQAADGDQPDVTVTASAPAVIDLHWAGIDTTGSDPGIQPAALDLALPGTTGTTAVSWTGGTVYQNGFLEYKPVSPADAG